MSASLLPIKKTCPCTILPLFFLIFQIPHPEGEVIKVYFSPFKKGRPKLWNQFDWSKTAKQFSVNSHRNFLVNTRQAGEQASGFHFSPPRQILFSFLVISVSYLVISTLVISVNYLVLFILGKFIRFLTILIFT